MGIIKARLVRAKYFAFYYNQQKREENEVISYIALI